ncbi:uncharacterized protein LOC115734670 isoform X1 [Rhodamnia argentea]|uniref:Uncharacterized protein LOC115734670 isoform X1 n=1 Tax=Rhodamnia argentea TaxID=178133 RepID=A0ABM3HPD6_9MYRT|nr:uncharacterized protein LOC115734670 isoform X1 [Rhodamnia argentea]
MGANVEVKSYPKLQQISKKGKERILSPRGSQSIKFPEKLTVENRQCLQNVRQHREPEENLDSRAICQNNSGNQQKHFLKGKVTKDDELVKHMKNLPGYLQSMEKGENLQGNALNVGVLDWARLEKWKPSQNCDFRKGRFSSSLSGSDKSLNIPKGSFSTDARTETLAQKSKLQASADFGPCSSGKDGLSRCPRPANRKFVCAQDAENVSNFTLDEKMKKKLASTYESSEGNHSNIKRKTGRTEEGKRTASGTNNPSNLKNHKKFLSSKDNFRGFDAHAVKKVVEIPQLVSKENYVERKNTSGIGASSSSESGKLEVPLIANKDEINEKVDGPRDSDIHLDYKLSSGKQKNIVLLLPKRFPKSNLAEMSQQNDIIRVSAQSSCRVNQSSFSGSLLSEEHSTELCPEIPYSCPLPSHDTTPREILHRPVMLSPDSSPHFPSLKKLPDIPSEVKCGLKHRSSGALLNQNLAANLKILELEAAEMESRRGSNSSPNCRFSFSLGRMRRSFSFKENTSVPQLRSTYVSAKSGPVGTGDAPCLDILSHDRVNVPTRGRSSPLRRLWDPLLKSRSANSHSSAENIAPFKGKLHSMSPRPITANELLVVEKHDESKVQALLQLTMKNGLPLFKFVVNNDSNILAATMKDSPPSGKDGAGHSYTFYSVNEIKKRGGWMGQGSKVKRGDFEYSVVGQMQVSDESFSHLAAESFGEHTITREFVLSGARQADAELPDFLPIRELAAIVFKIGADNIRCDGEQANCCKYSSNWNPEDSLQEHNCHFKFANSNHKPSCVSVILPRGVHALPNKGEPSPLIYRWKSGGSCDCGGWDIGCKLRVLSNQNNFSNTPNSKACSFSDCLELFVQGEAQLKSPIFRLAPFRKGIYSIEFDSSISLLQAFSISVAVLSCQTSSDPSEADCSPEISTLGELALSRNVPMRAPSMIKQGRAKYAPFPPLSPVGRV